MKSFEERKEKYLEVLEKNPLLVMGLTRSFVSKGRINDAELILNPKTDKELKYSESLVMQTFDILPLIMRINEQKYDLPCEENEGLNELINIYRDMIDGKFIYGNDFTMEQIARLFYGCVTLSANDRKKYVMDNIGLDRHNIMDLLTFKDLQGSLMNLVDEKKPDTEIKECDSYTDQEIDELYAYSCEFRRLCEIDRKEPSKDDDFEEIIEKIEDNDHKIK
jgi:hypothetical protein